MAAQPTASRVDAIVVGDGPAAAVHEGAQAASVANYFLHPPELKAD